jgi:hypothetical protein
VRPRCGYCQSIVQLCLQTCRPGSLPRAIHPGHCGPEALPRHMCIQHRALPAPPYPRGRLRSLARPGSQAKPGDRRYRLLGITLLDEAHPDQPGGRLELSVRPQFEGAHTGAPRGLTHVGDVNSLRHVKPAPWRAPSGDQPDGASFADHSLTREVAIDHWICRPAP